MDSITEHNLDEPLSFSMITRALRAHAVVHKTKGSAIIPVDDPDNIVFLADHTTEQNLRDWLGY